MYTQENRAQKLMVALTLGISMIAGVACNEPPLEEIAAAEAAIEKARQAEAETYAAETFGNALAHMKQAYDHNDEGDFDDSRTEAITAREMAEAAEREAIKRKQAEADKAAASKRAEDDQLAKDGYPSDVQSEAIGDGSTGEGLRISSLAAIYFDFDSAEIGGAEGEKLSNTAKWLGEHPQNRIRLEGHTDERGEAEYNLALGERRANAVKQYLATLGADAERLELVSMGEELPADPASTTAAYSKNRRVEFVVLKAMNN